MPVGWGIFCAAAAGLLFAGLYVFSGWIRSKAAFLSEKKSRDGVSGAKKKENFRQAAEGILVVLFLALGLLLRISRLQSSEGVSAYYEMAKVGAGQIPSQVSGTVYLYLQLLRGTFMVFGNKWAAGVWLQVLFQLLGCLFLYFALRKIGGIFPAVLSMAYLMLVPYNVGKSLDYSPDVLFLCIYAVGILAVGGYLKKQLEGAEKVLREFPLLICMGIVLGGILYLDIRGISLFVLLLSVCTLRHEPGERFWKSQAVKIPGIFLLSGMFFIGCLLWNAHIRGGSFTEAWNIWFSFLQGKAFCFDFWYMKGNEAAMFAITGSMVLGALGYWRFREAERMTPWFLLLFSCCILEFFQLPGEGLDGSLILPCLCIASCGVGLQACVGVGVGAEEKISEAGEEPEAGKGPETGKDPETGIKPKIGEKLDFIENPLPLPKKKVRKNMDYAFIPDETQMKYDIEVDDQDDFDI